MSQHSQTTLQARRRELFLSVEPLSYFGCFSDVRSSMRPQPPLSFPPSPSSLGPDAAFPGMGGKQEHTASRFLLLSSVLCPGFEGNCYFSPLFLFFLLLGLERHKGPRYRQLNLVKKLVSACCSQNVKCRLVSVSVSDVSVVPQPWIQAPAAFRRL